MLSHAPRLVRGFWRSHAGPPGAISMLPINHVWDISTRDADTGEHPVAETLEGRDRLMPPMPVRDRLNDGSVQEPRVSWFPECARKSVSFSRIQLFGHLILRCRGPSSGFRNARLSRALHATHRISGMDLLVTVHARVERGERRGLYPGRSMRKTPATAGVRRTSSRRGSLACHSPGRRRCAVTFDKRSSGSGNALEKVRQKARLSRGLGVV